MFEIHVTVSCPDLLAAAQLLVHKTAELEAKKKSLPASPTVLPSQAASPAVPVNHSTWPAASATASGQNSAPADTVAQAVPLAAAPTFTLEQICKAGADLVTQTPGMLAQVNGLLAQYGVQAVTDLKPEHFGAVATALRGMGAKI